MYNCKICNKEIKLLKNHLKNTHKMLECDYFAIFGELEKRGYEEFRLSLKQEFRECSPNSIHFYLKRGYTEEEANVILKNKRAKHIFNIGKEFRPNQINAMNNLARILTVSEDESIRNPIKAVELAKKACQLTGFSQPELLDTLAMAYAAAGNFSKAVEVAEKAISLCENEEKKELADEIKKRLQLYKAGKVYRESLFISDGNNP